MTVVRRRRRRREAELGGEIISLEEIRQNPNYELMCEEESEDLNDQDDQNINDENMNQEKICDKDEKKERERLYPDLVC